MTSLRFSPKNSQNVQKVILFSQWLNFFPQKFFFLFWTSSSAGKKRSKLDEKCKLLLSPVFDLSFSKIVKALFFFTLNTNCGKNFSKRWKSLRKLGPRTSPKKGHLMDAELVRKTLNIYNLTIKNAILIKLTTIIYVCETFHLPKNSDVTHRA